MVELKLDSYVNGQLPRDCFLSVRIGESQKLAVLANDRVFKFPQLSERRMGKVELFRRIGGCSIDVDPENPLNREVEMDCKDAGFGKVGLKFTIGNADGNVVKKKEEEKEPGGKKAGKIKAAREYLNKHGLEAHLSDAMQLVLRERPENPIRAFAEKLLAADPDEGRLPPVPVGKPKDEGPPMPASRVPEGPLEPEPQDKSVAPRSRPMLEPISGAKPAPAAQAEAAPEPIVPFTAYYHKNFRTTPEAMDKIWKQFPPPQKPAAAAAPAPAQEAAKPVTAAPVVSVVPFRQYYEQNFKVIDNAAYAKLHAMFPPQPVVKSSQAAAPAAAATPAVADKVPFRQYYEQNFKVIDSAAYAKIHTKFPPQPVVKSSQAAAPEAAATPAFAKKASVGTWLGSLPVAKLREGGKAAVAPAAAPPAAAAVVPFRQYYEQNFKVIDNAAYAKLHAKFPAQPVVKSSQATAPTRKWYHQASVGTWLAPASVEDDSPAAPAPAAAPRAAPEPTPAATKVEEKPPAKATEAPVPARSGNVSAKMPSVGTWLAKPQPVKKAEPSFRFKPSVGSWLAIPTADSASEVSSGKRSAAVVPSTMLLGPGFAGMGIRPSIAFI